MPPRGPVLRDVSYCPGVGWPGNSGMSLRMADLFQGFRLGLRLVIKSEQLPSRSELVVYVFMC